MIVGQGHITLVVGAGGCCLEIFALLYLFPPLSPSLWETTRYKLKYCLKGPLNPKQPTNQLSLTFTLCLCASFPLGFDAGIWGLVALILDHCFLFYFGCLIKYISGHIILIYMIARNV